MSVIESAELCRLDMHSQAASDGQQLPGAHFHTALYILIYINSEYISYRLRAQFIFSYISTRGVEKLNI